jgi:hypothetical protein
MRYMDLDQQLSQAPTLTPIPTKNVPPDIPPDPSISVLFPEKTSYKALDNPFTVPNRLLQEERDDEQVQALQEALNNIRAPFLFDLRDLKDRANFDGACVGVDMTADTFSAAVVTVTATLERGYNST